MSQPTHSALDEMLDYYRPSPWFWWQHVEVYGEIGLAHLSAQACVLARKVVANWSDEEILSNRVPTAFELTNEPIAAHVHIATGDLLTVQTIIAQQFSGCDMVTFQRDSGRLRRFPWSRMQRLTSKPNGLFILTTQAEKT